MRGKEGEGWREKLNGDEATKEDEGNKVAVFSGHVNTQPGSKAWGEKGGSILLSPPAVA